MANRKKIPVPECLKPLGLQDSDDTPYGYATMWCHPDGISRGISVVTWPNHPDQPSNKMWALNLATPSRRRVYGSNPEELLHNYYIYLLTGETND